MRRIASTTTRTLNNIKTVAVTELNKNHGSLPVAENAWWADLVGHKRFLPEKPPHGQHYERWYYADGDGDARNALYAETAHDTKGAAQTFYSKLPTAWHNSTWTADRAIHWLDNYTGDKPFCSWVSLPDLHHPFDCPLPWSLLHDPATIDLPPHRQRDFDDRPRWHEAV